MLEYSNQFNCLVVRENSKNLPWTGHWTFINNSTVLLQFRNMCQIWFVYGLILKTLTKHVLPPILCLVLEKLATLVFVVVKKKVQSFYFCSNLAALCFAAVLLTPLHRSPSRLRNSKCASILAVYSLHTIVCFSCTVFLAFLFTLSFVFFIFWYFALITIFVLELSWACVFMMNTLCVYVRMDAMVCAGHEREYVFKRQV